MTNLARHLRSSPSTPLALGVAALVTLAAPAARADDWGTPGLDAQHGRLSAERSGAAFGDGRWSYTPPSGARALASPVEADGFVVSADLDGTVTALHADSGALAWQVTLGSAIQGTPAIANGRLFIPAVGGAIVALGLADGTQLWATDLGGMNVSSPAIVGGDLIVGAGLPGQFIIRLDGTTGAIVWQSAPVLEVFSNTPPAVASGLVVVGTNGGHYYAFDASTGAARWDYRADGIVNIASPLIVGGRVYLAGGKDSDHVHAVDASTGVAIAGWPVSLPAPDPDLAGTLLYHRRAVSSFAAAGGLITLETRLDDALDTDGDGLPDHYLARESVIALDPGSGAVAWQRALARTVFTDSNSVPSFGTCPTPAAFGAVGGGTPLLAVASSLVAKVSILEAGSGGDDGDLTVAGRALASPVMANGRLITVAESGTMEGQLSSVNHPPTAPVLAASPRPLDAADVTLRWAAAMDLDGEQSTYELRIDTDGEVLESYAQQIFPGQGVTSVAVTAALMPGVTYSYAVRARDPEGALSPWSATETFTVATAGTVTVNGTPASSLRLAVAAAQAGDMIVLGVGTFPLTETLQVGGGVSVRGTGAGRTIIDGTGLPVGVSFGATTNSKTPAALDQATVTGAATCLSVGSGATGVALTHLVVRDCATAGISVAAGGGAAVVNATVAGNGIGVDSSGTATIKNSLMSGNTVGLKSEGAGALVSSYDDLFGNTTAYVGLTAGTGDLAAAVTYVDAAAQNFMLAGPQASTDQGDPGGRSGRGADAERVADQPGRLRRDGRRGAERARGGRRRAEHDADPLDPDARRPRPDAVPRDCRRRRRLRARRWPVGIGYAIFAHDLGGDADCGAARPSALSRGAGPRPSLAPTLKLRGISPILIDKESVLPLMTAKRWALGVAMTAALAGGRASAANCVWQGSGSGTGANFSLGTNWSCGAQPGSGDDVFFDVTVMGGANTACSFDAAVSVNSMTFQHGYTATATVGGTATTVVAGWTMASGTFTGGAGNITIGGGLSVTGGTFTASSGTTAVAGAFTHSSGTFNANGGTLYLNGATTVSHTFGGSTLASVQIGYGNSGLVGYWKLDEATGTTALDSSGNGNSGTWSSSGVSATTPVASAITFTDPAALALDGSSGYVTLGVNNLPANNAQQSISLWFKGTPNSGTNQNMIAISNLGASSAVQVGFRGTNLLAWNYGGGTLVSTAAPTDNAWHQVIYTYDGTTDSIYLDGVFKQSAVGPHQAGTPTTAYLGTYNPSSELFGGALDDVRVYNRVLSGSEISLLGAGSSPSTIAGTHTFNDAFACSGAFSILAGTVMGSSTLSVGGNWTNGGTYSDTGAVTLMGTSSAGTITSGGGSFGALTIGGSGGTYTLNDALSVTGNLSIGAGATLTGTKAITVGGNWSNAGAYSDVGVVTLTSASAAATITSGGGRFSALTINGTGTYTIADRLWVPQGTITLTSGTLNGGSSASSLIHVGAFSVGAGTFVPGSGTVVFDGTASQSLPFASFAGLRLEDPAESNLVGYWKLDEAQGTVIQDLSGNGNTGALSTTGMTWQTTVPSTVSFDDYAALSFSGTNSYAQLGVNNLPAINAAITISAWVNFTNISGNQNMVALVAGGNYLQLGIRGGVYTAWPAGAGTTVTGPAATTGSWHHVAYTYDGVSVDTIYVDGVAYTGAFTHQSGATTAAYLGTYQPPNSEVLAGALDDVRIYKVALTAGQVAQLAAGRYAGTGGYATTTLGANATVSGQLILDAAVLSGNGKTMNASLAASPALVNTGTYVVGAAAQTFAGGLTVQPGGGLTLASSGGSVAIGSGKTLTIDGALNGSNTGATIKSVSGTYAFKVGSTASATPTLNVSGLAVQNTDANGMWIGATTAASPTFTKFDNVAFSQGTAGGDLLQINAKSLYLSSSGCSFDAGVTATTAFSVALAGDGTGNGDTRAIFGGATCASNVASCQASKSDDDANNDGVGDSPGTNGAVVQFVRTADDDTAGSIVGLPTAAFNWSTFDYYSTYAAFHNASAGTSDVVYVRDESGNALYSWTVPTAGETITGTPQWTMSGTTHLVYVATSAGNIYRLIDTATGTTSGTLSLDTTTSPWSTTNPYNCSCTISTPLALDATNLYWGSTTSMQNFWTMGQSTQTVPTPISLTQAVTNTGLSVATIGSTSYAFMGVTGSVLQISTAGDIVSATNNSPGTHSVFGRIAVGLGAAKRVYAGRRRGDDVGDRSDERRRRSGRRTGCGNTTRRTPSRARRTTTPGRTASSTGRRGGRSSCSTGAARW